MITELAPRADADVVPHQTEECDCGHHLGLRYPMCGDPKPKGGLWWCVSFGADLLLSIG